MATVTKGKTFINGDLVTPAALHQLVDSATVSNISNGDLSPTAAIADTKLATIATPGKVANSATTATNVNAANAIVTRDAGGNFSAGTITATLNGPAANVYGTVAVANGGTGGTTAAAARAGLGLGDSATLNTGTTSGTVATGDHTHFQLHDRAHAIDSTSDHTAGNWKVFHSNGTGQIVELPLGAAGQVLTANGTSVPPTWQTLAATTTNANNLTGGVAGSIPYQSSAGATAMLSAGTSGQVLRSNGSAAPSWDSFGTSGNTANAVVQRDGFGNFSAGTITANLTGNANTATTATTAAACSGNAATATTLQTARTINGVSFNGSANITVTAAPDAHTHDASAITAGTLANARTTATNTNTASAIVARDASGNFSAGTITANLTGNVTGNVTGTASGNAPASGISPSAITGTAVTTTDSRLSDARPPTDLSVTTAKIANGAVTEEKLGTNEQKQICKAWVNFNGTTSPGTIRSSYNVSSVTKNGTGDYTVNFATAMADQNYSVLLTGDNQGTTTTNGGLICALSRNSRQSTESVRFEVFDLSTFRDTLQVNVAIFGN
jgi:hypothetical protein